MKISPRARRSAALKIPSGRTLSRFRTIGPGSKSISRSILGSGDGAWGKGRGTTSVIPSAASIFAVAIWRKIAGGLVLSGVLSGVISRASPDFKLVVVPLSRSGFRFR